MITNMPPRRGGRERNRMDKDFKVGSKAHQGKNISHGDNLEKRT